MDSRKLNSGLIGQRLIEAGYLTKEQLSEALLAQKETALLLGEVCLLKGWLNYDQLRDCLPPLRHKIGNKLLRCGLITIDQLWLAVLEQRQTGMRLGDIVVARGWVEQSALDFVAATDACPPRRKKLTAAAL